MKNKLTLVLENPLSSDDVLKVLLNHFSVNVKDDNIHLKTLTAVTTTEKSIKLNQKELLVLNYLKKGFIYSEIAPEMEMTIDGVRYYTKQIYKKLGVNNARQAILAVENLQ